jgi:uncharacterized protein YjbJ (UPF0337 family)
MQIHYEETVMNKDQVKGRIENAKGKVKEATGKITGNKTLEQKAGLEKCSAAFKRATAISRMT